jgi:hypothetical protein
LIEVVGHQHEFLGREIAEEGAGRDLGGVGDLFDRGIGVALLVEELERNPLNGFPGLDLLALAQAKALDRRPHTSNGS